MIQVRDGTLPVIPANPPFPPPSPLTNPGDFPPDLLSEMPAGMPLPKGVPPDAFLRSGWNGPIPRQFTVDGSAGSHEPFSKPPMVGPRPEPEQSSPTAESAKPIVEESTRSPEETRPTVDFTSPLHNDKPHVDVLRGEMAPVPPMNAVLAAEPPSSEDGAPNEPSGAYEAAFLPRAQPALIGVEGIDHDTIVIESGDLGQYLPAGVASETLDSAVQDVANQISVGQIKAGGSIVVATGMAMGYAVWTLRGGSMLLSLFSAAPAWRWLDPLPILERQPGRHRRREKGKEHLDEENTRLENLWEVSK